MLALWTDSNPIQRGQYYDIKVQAKVDNTSNGYLNVRTNDAEVVNYRGLLLWGSTYWEEGLYRSADASQIVAANFPRFADNNRVDVRPPKIGAVIVSRGGHVRAKYPAVRADGQSRIPGP